MSILEMTFVGGVMVLVITTLRAVLLNKLPKRTFIFLWEIAMLRLVLPISIPAATSVYSLFSLFGNSGKTAQTAPKTTVMNIPIISSAITDENLQAAERPLQGNAQAGVSIPVCAIVWVVGIVIALAVFVVGYIIVYRKYRYATTVKGGYVEQWLLEQKIRRNVQIRCSKQAVSPLTYGILCPTIVLPQSLEDIQSEQLTYILMHEMTHIRRFDMLRKIAAAAVLCIHWFNPIVWVLFLLYNRDIELACDETVLRKMKGDCRSAYAMALIGMEERRRGFSSLYNHFSRNAIEERIVAIMKTKKIGVISTVAGLALTLFVTCGFTTSAVTNERVVEETSIVAAAIPENANNKENEQKAYLRYVFDDDAIREVSEAEFQTVMENNLTQTDMSISEQRMLYYFVHDDNIYEMSEKQFNEVVEKNNIGEVIQRDAINPIEQSKAHYNSSKDSILSYTRATGSWSIDNEIEAGIRMNYFMPGGGSFVVNSGETVWFSIAPDRACYLTAGVYGSKNFSTPSSYIDMSSYYGITLGSDTPGSYKFYAINDNSFDINVEGSVSIF